MQTLENTEQSPPPEEKRSGVDDRQLVRASLARGRKYQFNGYPSGFTIKYVAFRGHPEDDGGLQGVAVKWWGGIRRRSMFYPCHNDAEFWDMDIFRNAFYSPNREL